MLPNLAAELGGSNRAVSPVIGIVLMIVVTTTLAAVVGGLATGMVKGVVSQPAPDVTTSAQLTDAGDIVIAHDGGDDLDVSNLRVVVRDANGGSVGISAPSSGTLETGDTFTVSSTDGTDFTTSSYEVLLIDTETDKIVDKSVIG